VEKDGKMKIINFYSFKGGAGRTMLTAQIARCLAALGHNVVVADFDFDAPGVPAAFGISWDDISGGIYDLLNPLRHDDDERTFEERIDSYLIPVSEGVICKNGGSIRILPVACADSEYFNAPANQREINDQELYRLFKGEYPDAAEREDDPALFGSFINLVSELNASKTEYLLIDSRAGITDFGEIAQRLADCQVTIFVSDKNTDNTLNKIALPHLKRLQEDYSLDKHLFVVSRMPPELSVREESFKMLRTSINNTFDCSDVLRLHSDLDSHFDSLIRIIDERYENLFDVDGSKVEDAEKKNIDIIQMHKDIFQILAALYLDEAPAIDRDVQLKEQAESLWGRIFNYPLKITYENRLFGLLESGKIQNIDDNKRNIAFKVETFLRFLNNFCETLKENEPIHYMNMMDEALSRAGVQCGTAFGKALVRQLSDEGDYGSQEQNIKRWCEFDSRAGFGKMHYDESEKSLAVKNLFIQDSVITEERDYTAFFAGYVTGVLTELVNDKSELINLRIQIMKETKKPLEDVLPVDAEDTYEQNHYYPNRIASSTGADDIITYEIKNIPLKNGGD
jgi:cellulose biosynthesis protein BcsQ